MPLPMRERVTRVVDGDTFMTDKRKRAVRLANVDAPEKGERGAVAATRRLARMIGGQEVSVEVVGRDAYGRPVAKVRVDGDSVNGAVKKGLTPAKRRSARPSSPR